MRVWRLSIGQLEGVDAVRPNVNARTVLLLTQDQLRGHPQQSSNFGGTSRDLLRQLDGKTEIGQLALSRFVEQDIIRLDISVDNKALMQELKAFKGFVQDVLADILRVGLA